MTKGVLKVFVVDFWRSGKSLEKKSFVVTLHCIFSLTFSQRNLVVINNSGKIFLQYVMPFNANEMKKKAILF